MSNSTVVIQHDQLLIRNMIEHIENAKYLLELETNEEVKIDLFKESILKLVSFLDSSDFVEIRNKLDLEEIELNLLIKQIKLLRVALTQSNPSKIEQLRANLIESNIIEFLNKLLILSNQLDKNPYELWLEEHQKLIAKLTEEFRINDIRHSTIKEFEVEFRKFMDSKLHVKFIKRTGFNYELTPVMYYNNEFIELPHPVNGERWLISGNPSKHHDFLKVLRKGDLLLIDYRAVSQSAEQFHHSLITIDYSGCIKLEKNINSILENNFSNIETKEIYRMLGLKDTSSQLLLNALIQVLVPESTELKQSVEEKRHEIKELKKEYNELEEKINDQRNGLTLEQKKWSEILERIDYSVENGKDEEESISYNPSTFIKDLQSRIYYADDNHLIYDESILELLISSVRANILTILSGPSGTGKSSLITAIGDAISNAKVTMVPVQSSWTDAQDLLGYFHPNEKIFVATPFMEALAEARIAEVTGKDELHIICLDEMNLAHIEYYFAQFLSIREQKRPTIQLYPNRYEKWAFDVDSGDIDASVFARENAKELIKYYPSNFVIPPNVRFVGTLNMDHTVKSLSPKVIDRSLVIELLKLTENEEKEIIETVKKHNNNLPINVPLTQFCTSPSESDEAVVKELKVLSNIFKDFRDVPLNSRGLNHLRLITSFWTKDSNSNIDDLKDLLIKGKILPRIEVKKSSIEKLYTEKINKLENYPKSNDKMQEMFNTNHTVSFW
jgi:hypothetical protein